MWALESVDSQHSAFCVLFVAKLENNTLLVHTATPKKKEKELLAEVWVVFDQKRLRVEIEDERVADDFGLCEIVTHQQVVVVLRQIPTVRQKHAHPMLETVSSNVLPIIQRTITVE